MDTFNCKNCTSDDTIRIRITDEPKSEIFTYLIECRSCNMLSTTKIGRVDQQKLEQPLQACDDTGG